MAGLRGPAIFVALLSVIIFKIYDPIHHFLIVVGAFRQPKDFQIASPSDFVVIDDTTYCEDIHYYAPAHTIFTACEDSTKLRHSWFPPLDLFEALPSFQGSIHVINPEVVFFKSCVIDSVLMLKVEQNIDSTGF